MNLFIDLIFILKKMKREALSFQDRKKTRLIHMRKWHTGCKRFLLFLILGLVNSQMGLSHSKMIQPNSNNTQIAKYDKDMIKT